jgi:hypothetical protein
MKNLYKNEMLRYVSECRNGCVSVSELVCVYKDYGRFSLGRMDLDLKYVKKRVEKFCRKNGVEINEIEWNDLNKEKIKVKNWYKF